MLRARDGLVVCFGESLLFFVSIVDAEEGEERKARNFCEVVGIFVWKCFNSFESELRRNFFFQFVATLVYKLYSSQSQ